MDHNSFSNVICLRLTFASCTINNQIILVICFFLLKKHLLIQNSFFTYHFYAWCKPMCRKTIHSKIVIKRRSMHLYCTHCKCFLCLSRSVELPFSMTHVLAYSRLAILSIFSFVFPVGDCIHYRCSYTFYKLWLKSKGTIYTYF